jgi:hypothetical protein
MKLIRVKCKDARSQEELKRMAVNIVRMAHSDPTWLKNIQSDYNYFKAMEGTELSKSEFAIYQRACLAELRRMKVIDAKPYTGSRNNQKAYIAYVVTPQMKILSGWEYNEDAKDDLNEWKENYPNAGIKVYSKAFLKGKGIDLDDNANWTNRP